MRTLDWRSFLKKKFPNNSAETLEIKVDEELYSSKFTYAMYGFISGMTFLWLVLVWR